MAVTDLGDPEPTWPHRALLISVIPLSVVFGTFNLLVARHPFFGRDPQIEEFRRRAWRHRRKFNGVLRRNSPIAPEQEPLARFWINQNRAASRILGWLGLAFCMQLTLSSSTSWWLSLMWIVAVAVWLGMGVYAVRLELAMRRWEAGRPSAGGAG